jgi:predicted dehydrogenase
LKKLNIAVIGYGHLGKWHCEKVELTGLANLEYIVELNPGMQKLAAIKFPNTKIINSIDEITTPLDGVMIITPTFAHFDLIKKAVQAGWNIFCEKPVLESIDQCEKIKPLLDKSNLLFQVGHSERYHLGLETIRDMIFQSENAFEMNLNRLAPFTNRSTDVDVISDLMIHDIDLVHYLTGKKIKWISASGSKLVTSKLDQVTCHMKLNQNQHIFLRAHRDYPRVERSLELTMNNKHWHVNLANCEIFHEGKLSPYPKRDHLFEEHKDFYQSIIHSKPSKVSFDEGARAVYISEQIKKSILLQLPIGNH